MMKGGGKKNKRNNNAKNVYARRVHTIEGVHGS